MVARTEGNYCKMQTNINNREFVFGFEASFSQVIASKCMVCNAKRFKGTSTTK